MSFDVEGAGKGVTLLLSVIGCVAGVAKVLNYFFASGGERLADARRDKDGLTAELTARVKYLTDKADAIEKACDEWQKTHTEYRIESERAKTELETENKILKSGHAHEIGTLQQKLEGAAAIENGEISPERLRVLADRIDEKRAKDEAGA